MEENKNNLLVTDRSITEEMKRVRMVHNGPDTWVARMISLLAKNWDDLSSSMSIKTVHKKREFLN